MPEGQVKTWDMVKGAFLAKYINVANNPVLLAEEELFQQMKLALGQPLEEFHSLPLEKGSWLGKSSRDITLKFIAGLPQQLSFNVRARGPTDHATALNEAWSERLMVIVWGQKVPTIPAVTAAVDQLQAKPSQISALESQIAEVTKTVTQVSRG